MSSALREDMPAQHDEPPQNPSVQLQQLVDNTSIPAAAPVARSILKNGRLRDSNGWDGKLRINKPSSLNPDHDTNAEPELDAQEDDSEEDEEEDEPGEAGEAGKAVRMQVEYAPEQAAIQADEDLCAEFADDAEEIDLVHCRIKSLPSLDLSRFTKVARLCLRQNEIQRIQFPDNLKQTLQELDLYDNNIKHVKDGLEGFAKLTILDLSFNNLRHVDDVGHLKGLTDLFLVQNRIKSIPRLEGFSQLRNLELGGNRVSQITDLDPLVALEQLWLGKNRISRLEGLTSLTSLKILSIQANHLREISGLETLVNLEELHISHNSIDSLQGLQKNVNLRVIDISSNPVVKLDGLESLENLEELWASNCQVDSFENIEQQLRDKKKLETVYFEGNPVQRRQPVLYRNKVRLALPQIKQIDATFLHS